MNLPIKVIDDRLSVAPQLSAEDMAAVAQAGYKSVVIHRPDYEAGPQQPTAQDVSAAARAVGLQVEYQPVVSGALTPEDAQYFAQLLQRLPTPILAYCRSGGRCESLYVAAQQL